MWMVALRFGRVKHADDRSPRTLPGVEIFAEAVANEVEGQDGESDGDSGEDQRVGRSLQR